MTNKTLPELVLKKREEKRLKQGHLWVYSNEVDTQKSPLKAFEAGQLVRVVSDQGKPLGTAYINPNQLICARLLTRQNKVVINETFFKKRFQAAQALRDMVYDQPYYRLVFGESDFLPGLVVDRFGDALVVQITTAGMEALKPMVMQVLENLYHPRVMLFRNDLPVREQEGLSLENDWAPGSEQPETVPMVENGATFEVPIVAGQKTGWFYDHRSARAQLQQWAKGKRVLDVFSYAGAWGIEAAVAGASDVTCVDASAKALDWVDRHGELNGVADRLTGIEGNAFDALKSLAAEGHKYDVVVIDPPAFIKRKKDLKEGTRAYQRLNELAIRLVEPGGLLVSASCSYHLSAQALLTLAQQAARQHDRQLQLLSPGHQSPDHPVHPAIQETDYLKSFFFRVTATV
ncbi:class I SAM-dependent rRNA methyltransferase [Thiomicrospira sp. WB1]|uniref:class I SAM-dependent rRNA methyltransferase n=1 Tax=Thiomicrospira sp. WB1 TaxID=1685380 RepID=UPI0007460869|nr:class I SAM-dependent rRNA methyltransferase [Thiomicrospira sp. WB1]KUJ72793.1 SAM-dependent methyltransferase [Thiomicrospira sp. WB1]